MALGLLAIVFVTCTFSHAEAQESHSNFSDTAVVPAAETVLAPITGIKKIAVGYRTACALTLEGRRAVLGRQ